MVASPGASMPGTLGHAADGEAADACTTACLGSVSVVMIARAAASPPPSSSSDTAAALTPSSSFAIGSRSPMSPVEQTRDVDR